MTAVSTEGWERLCAAVVADCPRLSPVDLARCHQRPDLLVAAIQNRQWISAEDARRVVLRRMSELGLVAV